MNTLKKIIDIDKEIFVVLDLIKHLIVYVYENNLLIPQMNFLIDCMVFGYLMIDGKNAFGFCSQ